MHLSRTHILGLAFGGTAALFGFAGISSSWAAEGAVLCHASARFFVVERERGETIGSDFLARPKTEADESPACVFDDGAAGFRMGGPDSAYHFDAIKGDHLILDNAAGAEVGLVVFNLQTRRKTLDVPVGDDVLADETGVTFWQRTGDATTANCRDFAKYRKDGFGARIETRQRFAFATGTVVPDTQTRCAPSP